MIRIGLIQMTCSKAPEDNLVALLSYAQQAVSMGVEYIFSPECSNVMDMNRQAILQSATFEDQDLMVDAVRSFCRQHKVCFFLGSVVVKVSDQRLANRSLVIDQQGDVIARYDKIHLFDVSLPNGECYHESRLYQAGHQVVTAQTQAFVAGLSVCYDLRFPYLYRKMALSGASVLCVPAAFTVPTGQAHWHNLLQAQAIENGCFVIAAAQSGLHQTGRATFGHSLVIDPWGTILLDAGGCLQSPETGVHCVDIDLDHVHKVRHKIPSLEHGVDLS